MESRSYKVVLADRTTSPKVNRYIRDLTGKSVWEASQVMNTVPSVILENIPLSKAIEVKSQLGKLGLTAKIETVTSEIPDTPPPSSADTQTPEPAPSVSPDTEASPPPEPAPQPEKIDPLPPSRLRHAKKLKKNNRKIIIPFIILFIIVIIILLIGGCPDYRIKILEIGRISQQQELPEIPAGTRFIPSDENISDRLKKAPGSPYYNPDSSYAPHDSGDNPPPMTAETTPSAPLAESSHALTPPANAGSSGQNPLAASGGKSSSPVGSQTPSSYNNAQQMPAVSGKSPGTKSSPLSDRPRSADAKIPSDFVGGKSPKITPAKLNALLDQAKIAAASADRPSASLDLQRLKLAQAAAEPAQFQITDRLESSDVQNLLDQLAPLAGKFDLTPQLAFQPEITGASLKIQSNLPDQTLLTILLALPGASRPLEYTLPLENGMVEIPISGGLPSGNIGVKIVLEALKKQPMEVLSVVGRNGENLNGPAVKGRGVVEFTSALKNKTARSRGEIGVAEAEAQLNTLIQAQGLNKYKLSDFSEFAFEKKIFVTVSADGVDEAEFILKACRSVGLLTQEMDDPPLYLRLVVNGGQYFITTFQCRRLLREYRENDPAAFDLLLENLITL